MSYPSPSYSYGQSPPYPGITSKYSTTATGLLEGCQHPIKGSSKFVTVILFICALVSFILSLLMRFRRENETDMKNSSYVYQFSALIGFIAALFLCFMFNPLNRQCPIGSTTTTGQPLLLMCWPIRIVLVLLFIVNLANMITAIIMQFTRESGNMERIKTMSYAFEVFGLIGFALTVGITFVIFSGSCRKN